MQKREKVLAIVTLLLVIIMISKSLVFDEVKPKELDEIKFKSFVEKRIEDGKEDLGFIGRTGIVSYRVVRIEKTNDNGSSKIVYYDQGNNAYQEGTIKGTYKAKVRGYILSVIPYKELSVEVGD